MSAVKSLHIIEPTLRDQTGHCFSLLRDLLAVVSDKPVELHVWMHKHAQILFESTERISEHRFFSRRLRRLQALKLYRKLLKDQQPFLVSTATSTDLFLLDLAARTLPGGSIKKAGLVWLYVHWFYPSDKKIKRLQIIAKKHPGLEILCPTDSVQKVFVTAGFKYVQVAPYPSGPLANNSVENKDTPPFKQLLYAGAARSDKGFSTVVDLVELLAEQEAVIPISMQCSTTHKGKHSEEINRAIERLSAIDYEGLVTQAETLNDAQYQALFYGSIVLQSYDAKLFYDRISGVTLDALKAGSPVIVPAGTWMARQVSRFEAGIILEDARDAQMLLHAVKTILADWERFAQNARVAGRTLGQEHDPVKLVNLLLANEVG